MPENIFGENFSVIGPNIHFFRSSGMRCVGPRNVLDTNLPDQMLGEILEHLQRALQTGSLNRASLLSMGPFQAAMLYVGGYIQFGHLLDVIEGEGWIFIQKPMEFRLQGIRLLKVLIIKDQDGIALADNSWMVL